MNLNEAIAHCIEKANECSGTQCGCAISAGTRYRRQTNKYNGTIYDFSTHEECEDVAQLLHMYDECDDNGLTEEDFQNYINEYNDDYDKSYYDRVRDILRTS